MAKATTQKKRSGHGNGPIGGFQKPKDTKKTLKRLLGYVGQHPIMLIVGVFCVIAAALAGVAATYVMRPIINDIAAAVTARSRSPCRAWRSMWENSF